MMKYLKMWILAMQIERKWKRIKKNRQRMEVLINQEEPFTSPKLIRLDQQTTCLGYHAKALEQKYRKIG